MTASPSTVQLHGGATSPSRSFQGTTGPYIQNNLAPPPPEELQMPDGVLQLQGAEGGCDISYDVDVKDKNKAVHFDNASNQV